MFQSNNIIQSRTRFIYFAQICECFELDGTSEIVRSNPEAVGMKIGQGDKAMHSRLPTAALEKGS